MESTCGRNKPTTITKLYTIKQHKNETVKRNTNDTNNKNKKKKCNIEM